MYLYSCKEKILHGTYRYDPETLLDSSSYRTVAVPMLMSIGSVEHTNRAAALHMATGVPPPIPMAINGETIGNRIDNNRRLMINEQIKSDLTVLGPNMVCTPARKKSQRTRHIFLAYTRLNGQIMRSRMKMYIGYHGTPNNAIRLSSGIFAISVPRWWYPESTHTTSRNCGLSRIRWSTYRINVQYSSMIRGVVIQ